MPVLKLTKKNIDAIPAPTKPQELYWDTELKGFGLRVTPSIKVFVVQMRVGGSSPRVKLGNYGALTPEEARNLARIKLGLMTQGINPNEEKRESRRRGVTLKDAYEQYISGRQLRANTKRDYEKAMRLAFADWQKTPLSKITRTMVERRFEELSRPTLNDDGTIKAENKAFANQAFRFLRALLNWASEKYTNDEGEPLLPSNPCNRLKGERKWHDISARKRWVRPDQLWFFFESLRQKAEHTTRQGMIRDLCIIYVLTGLRLMEGASLRWSQVNLVRKTITITADRAKNHMEHELPIGNWLAQMLSSYAERRQRLKESERSPFVFPAPTKSGHVSDFADVIESICKECGFKFTPHDLRRTFITIANKRVRGLTAYTAKQLVNHAVDKSDVTGGYIIRDPETLRDPMQQVEDYILQAAGVLARVEGQEEIADA